MNTSTSALDERITPTLPSPSTAYVGRTEGLNGTTPHRPVEPLPPDQLRSVAWAIGSERPLDQFIPLHSHIGLAMVHPYQGFVHWRIKQEWIDTTARHKGDAWHHCRLIVRLYDVSYVEFNGLNAHSITDIDVPAICGYMFFQLARPGTWQLAEVGFLLRNGEFLPAARSQTVPFAPDAVSGRGDHAALLVDESGHVEEVGNLWEQDKILEERRRPKVRSGLTIATFAMESLATGYDGILPRFVTELAQAQAQHGHRVHVFVPQSPGFTDSREVQGVHYHPLPVPRNDSPLDIALNYARSAEQVLLQFPPFDLYHVHEWITGLAPWIGTRPTVLSLSSIESVRRNGAAPTPLSMEIQKIERQLAHAADLLLTPDWLRERAIAELAIDEAHVHSFPMDARLPNEWERPLDYGQIKKDIGFGPLDRLLLFVGPLEYAAGVDLLLEALPVVLRRAPNVRLAFAGQGSMHGTLEHRMHQLGIGYAVRLLGHVDRGWLSCLMRASEAVVLPSRQRVPFDDAVVDLARKASRAVVTTHGGPAYLIQHEENGLVTYDNPGSMVWALDRILSDPHHTERMGQAARRSETTMPCWGEVARLYFELCAGRFPELNESRGRAPGS
ncbi:MAG: glycosyltransferase [Gemmataceae bacterium]